MRTLSFRCGLPPPPVHALGMRGHCSGSSSLIPLHVHTSRASVKVVATNSVYWDLIEEDVATLSLDCELPNDERLLAVPVSEEWIDQQMQQGRLVGGDKELDIAGASWDPTTGALVLPRDGLRRLINNHEPTKEASNHGNRAVGTKRVLVVRVVAPNAQPSVDVDKLSDSAFGTFGDQVNLQSQYGACSRGKLTFESATGQGIVNGVLEVSISSLANATRFAPGQNLREAVTSLITQQLGTSPRNVFMM
eukprot:scaffold4226_cov180-Amphora_coffeaeformis.AAC.13